MITRVEAGSCNFLIQLCKFLAAKIIDVHNFNFASILFLNLNFPP